MSVLQSKRRAIINEPHKATSSGAIVQMDKAEYAPMGVVANFTPVQEGSGDPSPDNIRPISGWTGCNVYDDSKLGQLVDWNQLVENGNFTDTTGWRATSALSIAAANNVLTATATGETIGNTQYITTTVPQTTGHKYLVKYQCKSNKLITNRISIGVAGVAIADAPTITLTTADTWTDIYGIISAPETSNDAKLWLYVNRNLALTTNDTVSIRTVNMFDLTQDFGETIANEIYAMEQAEAGAGVAYFKSLFYKPYYPYSAGGTLMTVGQVNGEPYRAVNVDWTDEAGTVYGGSLDLTSGVLTAKYGYVDLGTLNWTKHSDGYPVMRTDDLVGSIAYADNMHIYTVCDTYLSVIDNGHNGGLNTDTAMPDKSLRVRASDGRIYLYDSAYTDATIFTTAMNGHYLAYELLTPITYNLTPQQIKSLRGKNNVWTDMNAPTDVSAWVH